ncbi:NAD-dependent epimerase/dehydratase family protein [Sandaracinus amylolyticus]|uniref:NAD-dependent epimerase/dehydratase family protein n=1 Tax=Sandaracinus amylolyticus TaxID=927083 RepID=UPI001F028A48|nr:NAD-dependent epimerase/dehydratase family protein [Sandaracinus amylolyticus]UJR81307.1 NAD-dependent dehydratase [Sandaracinus amylolyticus]
MQLGTHECTPHGRDAGAPNGSARGGSLRALPPRGGRTVAITGACSFLGRNLIGVLEEDDTIARVVVLDVATPRTAGRKTRSYRVDLTQPTAAARASEILRAEQVDVLAHLAFLSSPTPAEGWAHELESVGTMHLLVAAREAGVRRVVAASQTMLYGPHRSNPNFLFEGAALRGIEGCRFLADKIDAEVQLTRFASETGARTTILRLAPVLGPTVRTWLTRWLSRRFVPTLLGFDPLVQLLHEADAIAALKTAIDVEVPGTFNVAGEGVLPITTIIKLAGRIGAPLPGPLLRRATALLWMGGMNEAPASFVDYLRYLCVADTTQARDALGFEPAYTTREAVLDFGGALRLREARLIREAIA